MKKHTLNSRYQSSPQKIRVILPESYTPTRKYHTLYVLPVEKGFDNRYGDGLSEMETLNAHNRYELILVQPGFAEEPWYGNHASNEQIQEAKYLKEGVIPFFQQQYSTTESAEGRLLFGFSKSGRGAYSLIFNDPDFYGFAAAQDAPMMLDSFGWNMEYNFGTLEQLNRHKPHLLAAQVKHLFSDKTRLVLGGEKGWGNGSDKSTAYSHLAEQ